MEEKQQDILRDPLFETAAKLMVSLGGGKSSDLQKRFSIGYYTSQLMLSAMEELGILSSAGADGTRRALIDAEQLKTILFVLKR